MDGNLSNTELATAPEFDMKDSVVLVALAVSVVIDVSAVDGDVVDVKDRTF